MIFVGRIGKEKRIIAAFCDYELYHSRDVIPIKIELEAKNYENTYLELVTNVKEIISIPAPFVAMHDI